MTPSDPRPPEAVGVDSVVKRYVDGDRRIAAVDDVTLSVPPGVLWVLSGPSGSGKTTLLGLLGGLLVPTRGEARVWGKPVAQMRDHHRTRWRRTHVGFVFQELALIPHMSLLENVLLPMVPEGKVESSVDRARGLLAQVGLEDRADSPVERLSGGQRQRGAIVRALVHAPEVLLLDEPTAHVDAENAEAIVSILVSLRDEGRTIVASTHDPRLVEHAGVDRVVGMRDGALVLDDARR